MPLLQLHQPTVAPAHDNPGGIAARAWSAIACAVLTLGMSVAGLAQAQGPQISLPNGYMTTQGPTLSYASSGGGGSARSAGSSRSGGSGGGVSAGSGWDGKDWKHGRQWDSLSRSWKNLTGSDTADTTGALGSTSGGGEPGCWVWVDEDWEPSPEMVTIGGVSKPAVVDGVVQMQAVPPIRTTPFNRIMGDGESGSKSDYPPGIRVSLDYATLCMGSGLGMVDAEALRLGNELYLGDNGRYARCNVMCNAESALGDAFMNCGEVNWAQNAKDCLKSCIFAMLPVPDPCGKFGKLFSLVAGAAGGNSFTGETLVHIRDRQGKPALKPIADIKIGDEVLAWDEMAAHDGQLKQSQNKSGQEVQAKTGASAQQISATRYEKVSDLITSEKQQRLVHITLAGGKRITATDGHPFRTGEGWRDAILLKKGGKLLLKGSGEGDDDSAGGATIEDVRIEVKTVRVYNLEVENLHTFFVGDEGVLVHNGRSGTSGENGPARRGREQHDKYRPEGFERPTLPSGKRPDGVNYEKKIVVELTGC